MLGSSLFGAQLAAHLGLPYAFASHFAPDALEQAAEIYRVRFNPGVTNKPCFMLAINVFGADSDAEGTRLKTSMQQAFISPDKVKKELSALIERHRPDEVILTGQIHDHSARLRSFEIAAEAMQAIGVKSGAAAT